MTAIRRTGILLRGLSSVAILFALVVGVPGLLLGTVGNPVPDQWTWTSPLTTDALLGLLACVAWAFWAQLVVCVIVEVIAEIRLVTGRSSDWLVRVPGTFGGQQLLARSLVQAVIAIGLTSAPTGASTPWIESAHAAEPAVAVQVATTPPLRAAAQPRSPTQPTTFNVTVERGDTLWSIAERHLGVGERWREIAELNRGREMPGGSTFDDARTILPGWELLVPSVSRTHAAENVVTVERGDTLWGLAEEKYGDGAEWPRIYDANSQRIEDPHWIFPGQRFVVPDQGVEKPQILKDHQPPADQPAEIAPPADAQPPAEAVTPTERTPETVGPWIPAEVDEHTQVVPDASEHSGVNTDGATITRALLGGGGFLAAGMLAVYVGRRRTQTRNRRSGRAAPSVAPRLRADDKALSAIGTEAGQRTGFFDSALRELAQLTEDSGRRLPDAAAARIDDDLLELHLASPDTLAPEPWNASTDGLKWSLSRAHVHGTWDRISPYPSMVTLGDDDHGGTWLLDLESAGVTQIVGDPSAGADLARFIAAELALNPWSDAESVSVVGIGKDVVPLNYGRLFADPRLDIDRLTKLTHQMAETVESSGRDVLVSRVVDWKDAWVPTVAIGNLGDEDIEGTMQAVADLINEMELTPTRTSVALVLVSTESIEPRALMLRLHGEDRLETPWGFVRPNRLTNQDAVTLGELFDDTETDGDEPIPVALRSDAEPSSTNEAGALVEDLTEPRCGTGDPHSVLPRSDRAYIDAAATTTEDLAALAPEVPPSDATRAIAADPTLDADVAQWLDPTNSRPKLRVLGPVELHAEGERTKEVDSRPAYFAELAAYLACHPAGRTPNEVAADFGIQNNTLHTRLGQLRKWLGKQPGTDEWYLPNALRIRGQQVYRIEAVLVDADLFRRLRARGEARGPEGIEDLRQALDLVTGRPYDQPRSRGYGWLVDTPFDHYLTAAIVDVAHIVATYGLTEGQPKLALWAAEKAITAAPSEDKPRLDLARAMHAMGKDTEAESFLRHEVLNRTDDDRPPLDPSERTKQITHRLDQNGRG